MNRNHFVRQVLAAGIGILFRPSLSLGNPLISLSANGQLPDEPPAGFKPNKFGIVDLHCHPSLKMYLWGRHFWSCHCQAPGMNLVDLQDDIQELSTGSIEGQDGEGFVKGIVCAHYLVERAAEQQWDLLRHLFPGIKLLFGRLARKIENGDWSNFTQINKMIDELEYQAQRANKKQRRLSFVIARDYGEFETAIRDGQFPIAHAIEGAHALGRNLSISKPTKRRWQPEEGKMAGATPDDPSKYIRNLWALKARGVCMITLAHLFQNDIAFCTEGISPDGKRIIGMKDWKYNNDDEQKYNRLLTPIGEAVAKEMLEIGMVIDLTHSTPRERDQVFAFNRARKDEGKPMRPIVFTHTGAQELFNRHDAENKAHKAPYLQFGFYCVSATDIQNINECNGAIGVIPEVFWLAGGDTNLKRPYGFSPDHFREGIPYMVETILFLNQEFSKIKGQDDDYHHISLGTDFDGLADAPEDLFRASQLGGLIMALKNGGLTDDQIRRITSGNALRVLKEGWIKTPPAPASAP